MSNIAPLYEAWLAAKSAEAKANKERLRIEADLVKALDVPEEGSKTQDIDGYKVTVTQPVSRKLDAAEWERVKLLIEPVMWPIKMKAEADASGCKYLANNEPETWAMIASAFTTTPGKVGFKITKEDV